MKLPRFAGVVYARVLALCSSVYWRTPPALRPFLPWLGGFLLWGTVLAVIALLSGCQAKTVPITHITLPPAATVDKLVGEPTRRAQASNDRAVQLAAQADVTGLVAGSAASRTLTLATQETRAQLNDVLAGKDALTAQLLEKQAKVDALEKDDAAKTATVATQAGVIAKQAATIKTVEHSRWIWRFLVALSLVADFLAGHLLEKYLRGAVSFCWRWIGAGYHLGAGALKAAFPLYTFWLPS